MADQSNRLTKSSGFTIADIIKISWQYYKSTDGDNKASRAKVDILSAKCTARKNYEYNQSTKEWSQTGRDVRIDFIIKSDPKSYKKTDNIKTHKYPCTFLLHDIDSGIYSTFKWRTGSNKKPIFKNPTMTSAQIAEKNIRNGIQMGFIFHQMWALKVHNLLFGPNYTSRPAIQTNPKNIPFFDKHSYYIAKNILIPMLQRNGGILKNALSKNKDVK